MSNTVIALLAVFAFAAGLGVGLIVVMRPRKPEPRVEKKVDSTIYFGRDVDHPDDIERQHAHRYDGMTDRPAGYVPSGLDFGRFPR